ncbi:hypothetical protein GCM10009678_21940 [Actinomadura kijaniata]|uniref:Uncharacterized protein n=1 Tax=Actinomadura namibiensis TaxID=182080 RepID=A0A7W3LN99_ACTNM|nr:hypothetical protein [Actinomadura namibiensis]MBA8951212.1 hypothetical protein [Actinomadura namibiensis]
MTTGSGPSVPDLTLTLAPDLREPCVEHALPVRRDGVVVREAPGPVVAGGLDLDEAVLLVAALLAGDPAGPAYTLTLVHECGECLRTLSLTRA